MKFLRLKPDELHWNLAFFLVLIWSGLHPKDPFTWFLEVFPALLGWILIWSNRRSFPLTPLVLWLCLAHMFILMVGGHYTYAEVPFFDYLRDTFHGTRNQYDRLGHFAQGFVPALVTREILWRRSPLKQSAWLPWVIIAFCLSISALYELFEWLVAVSSDESAEAFLGTQGDPWDTQKDMFLCLIGCLCSLFLLSGIHQRQIEAQAAATKKPVTG